ncbi:MAG: peptidoglycan DD-metalloendopeptidase family protein [Candidatus Krumholzibacteriia bacterium]
MSTQPRISVHRPGGRPLCGLLLAALLLLVPTARGAAPAAWYTVRAGDSIGKLSRLLGVTTEQLHRDNPVVGKRMRPGQRLRVTEPLRGLKATDLHWRRPLAVRHGPVLRAFGAHKALSGGHVPHTGIDVAVPIGTVVHAPATGVVRYCGPQDGFGTVIILEHAAGWSTVLSPLEPDTSRCKAGEIVLRGDELGTVGAPHEGTRPCLHVELREGRRAVRPTRLLR